MDSLVTKAEQELARAVVALVMAEPFLGHVVGQLPRTLSQTATATLGVTLERGRLGLVVNPSFYTKTLRRRDQRVAVVKHEILHVILRHVFRREPAHDPFLYNVAADLVVNQLIGARWALPESAITLARFEGLAPDETVEAYYEALRRPASARTRETLATLRAGWHSDHAGWSDAPDTSRAVAEAEVRLLLSRASARAGRDAVAGLDPGLRAAVASWLAPRPPRVDWRRVLRIFGASSQRSRLRPTLRRPSKRYGTFPGHRVRRYARLAVVVDTSGSIDDDLLEALFAEVHAMWRTGAEITVIECDATVQRTYAYEGTPPDVVFGRGGTAFDPALDHVRGSAVRYDGCVFLTDGMAAPPARGPGCPLLWLLAGEGSDEALRFGRVLRLG